MIRVHHLNASRSHRILWLMEELGCPYDIVRYQRETSGLAPRSLRNIHPLGKSPIVEEDGRMLAESGQCSRAASSQCCPDPGRCSPASGMDPVTRSRAGGCAAAVSANCRG